MREFLKAWGQVLKAMAKVFAYTALCCAPAFLLVFLPGKIGLVLDFLYLLLVFSALAAKSTMDI